MIAVEWQLVGTETRLLTQFDYYNGEDHTYQYTIPQNAMPGSYQAIVLTITDCAGNVRTYTTLDPELTEE